MELLIQLLYFTLLLSPFIVGMLRHDKSVRHEQNPQFIAWDVSYTDSTTITIDI